MLQPIRQTRGFTIVELLIVIVVIAILAAVTVVAFNSVRNRAEASGVISQTRNTEQILRLFINGEGYAAWPDEDTLITDGAPLTGNPTIRYIIAHNSVFRSYARSAPTAFELDVSAWSYDYDDSDPGPKGSCTDAARGTNIVITGVSQGAADIIEAQQDDDNYACGKWRYVPANERFYYTLSYTNSL